MKTGTKVAIGAGIGLAAIGIYKLTRPAQAAPPTGVTYKGSVALAALASSALEGSSQSAAVSVTNTSTRAGGAISATFEVRMYCMFYGTLSGLVAKSGEAFAAGQTKPYTYSFTMPSLGSLSSGSVDIHAEVYDPNNVLIASDVKTMGITPAPPAAAIMELIWGQAQPFPPYQVAGLAVRMQNLASHPYTYTLEVFNAGVLVTTAQIPFSANWIDEHAVAIPTGAPGTYSVIVRLSYGSDILDEKSATYTVAAVEVKKDGRVGNWLIWYEGLGPYWQNWSGVDVKVIPVNTEVYVAVMWLNYSEVSVTGHIDLSANNKVLSATLNQDKSALPGGGGWYVEFEPFVLVGATYLYAALTVDGIFVDNGSRDITVI